MKNLKIFLIVVSLFSVNQLSNATSMPVFGTITSFCNAVVKAKNKVAKKHLIAACIEYTCDGYDNDWEDETFYAQPDQSGQGSKGSKGGAGGSLPGLKGGAGGSGKSSSRSRRGRDGADGKSYTGGVGGKGGASGKAY